MIILKYIKPFTQLLIKNHFITLNKSYNWFDKNSSIDIVKYITLFKKIIYYIFYQFAKKLKIYE